MTRPVGLPGRPNRGALSSPLEGDGSRSLLYSSYRRLSRPYCPRLRFASRSQAPLHPTPQMLQLAGRRSRKSGGGKRPQERGCGHRRSSGVSAHFGRRFYRSSIVIDGAAGGNDQAVELLGRRSLVDGRSASGVASSAEEDEGDALAVLHVKGCEIGEFRSSGHLANEFARRAG